MSRYWLMFVAPLIAACVALGLIRWYSGDEYAAEAYMQLALVTGLFYWAAYRRATIGQ